jgi:ATP phosphoribosyltransferase regulatory subunit HisZ
MARLRYPTGVRPLLIEETARRRRVETRIVSILEREGFAEVVVPIIDYEEPYVSAAHIDRRQTYRFVDRDGDLVAIRSDFTPMVARSLAPEIGRVALPLRVFYRGDVVRLDPPRLGRQREMFQIGAEIVGDGSPAADEALLAVATESVRALGIEPMVVRSESRDGYYTGFCFHLYDSAARGVPIAQGGRYDSLYERFGGAAPAVGFTLTIDDSR